MDKPEENMVNAGVIFMSTAWIQGQMADLVIFVNNPDLILDFIKNPARVPAEFHRIRVSYWEKQFGEVKNEFKDTFSNVLTDDEKRDAEEIYHLRNMIAHAHVSVGRDYMLYRPDSQRRERKLIDDLKLQSIDDQSDPIILKIELWRKDKFQNASNLIGRFEQVTLKKIADSIGVPHGRIR
jgi:hypothetical protein